ncbi:MAG: hypothetical protein WBB25_18000 [Sulfitobacter sp.]
MVGISDIKWFKETFWGEIKASTDGTAFDPDMLISIACQETGSIWGPMRRKGLPKADIVRLCCGDTLDSDKGRRAFPKTRAALEVHLGGTEMFQIGRAALLAMSEHVPGYGFAKDRPDKFCHGYGVFQLDLQYFKSDPEYFLRKRYEDFGETLGRALGELQSCLKKRGLDDMAQLSDFGFVTVAIAYNTGGYRPNKGLKQGHFDGAKFYGEHVNDFLALARSIPGPDGSVAPLIAGSGPAIITATQVPQATGPHFRVDTMLTSLRLRSEPEVSDPLTQNVLAEMPDGWLVRAFDEPALNGFQRIEVNLDGALFDGYVAQEFLRPTTEVSLPEADISPLVAQKYPAVLMPRKAGTRTLRKDKANAHSLNEDNMPIRTGGTPEDLRSSLADVIGYLNPANKAHKRYAPRDGLTFCNIYAHDFCALAGVYFPRVWWNDTGLAKIQAGQDVAPLYGNTIREMRANDLFRWLRDYGAEHGWQRAIDATELQNNANLGAVCLIIARRKQEGKSGHVVAVVAETSDHAAKRMPGGEVSSPLQSQAGSSNFNFGTGRPNWWRGNQFAESAMWFAR